MIDATCFSLRSMTDKLRDSVVSRQLGYFYIPIGKAANTEIKRKLWQIEYDLGYPAPPPLDYFGVHSYGWHKNQISERPWSVYSQDDYITMVKDLKALSVFSVVRNPYIRLLSGYLDKMSVGKNLTRLQKIEKVKTHRLFEYPETFESFVQQVCQQSDHEADLHWQSQSYILCFDFIKYDAIGHVEHIEKFYEFLYSKFLRKELNEITDTQQTILHKTSASSQLANFYTPKLIENVYQRYEQDFTNFNYNKSINFINPINIEKNKSNGKYDFLLDLIGELVYEAKHNKSRKIACQKIENWSQKNSETVIINNEVMRRTGYVPFENLSNKTIKSTIVSDARIKKADCQQVLSTKIIQGALVTPLVKLKSHNDPRYAKTVDVIGGIYNSNGEPYKKSLLIRANNRFQDFDNDYKPVLDHKTTRIKKGVYGGLIFFNHYGHFLLETLSRAWALKEYPEEDVYFHLNGTKLNPMDELGSWQEEIWEAALINIKRLHFITETSYFDELIVPDPGYVLQTYCHKKQARALTEIGQRIKAKSKIKAVKEKIWLSRSSLKKGAIAGEKEFEQELKEQGFAIIHPELIPLKDQIVIFENADTIAGFTGSAFHTLLFTKNHKAKIIHFTRGKTPHNDFRICAEVKGYQAEYHNFFIKNGELDGVPANVIQDFEKIWQVLYEHRLVERKIYHDPDLELKLQKLDEETKKYNPNLFKEKIPMNGKASNQNIGQKKTTRAPSPAITHSARRINKLAKEIDLHNYLEIGVNKGQTFFNVSIPQKTAVDPKFIFDISTVTDKNITLKQTVSDAFFSALPITLKYDAIFIDGLHTFEQTYRDLCNSLLHSHERTIFLIDDTKPSDVYSAFPQQGKAVGYRKQAGGQGWAWHGDVYKVVFALHDFHPGLNYRTIIGSGNPQTLVWRSKSGWREPLFNSLEQISRLSYFELLDNINILRSCSEEEAIRLCLNELANQ